MSSPPPPTRTHKRKQTEEEKQGEQQQQQQAAAASSLSPSDQPQSKRARREGEGEERKEEGEADMQDDCPSSSSSSSPSSHLEVAAAAASSASALATVESERAAYAAEVAALRRRHQRVLTTDILMSRLNPRSCSLNLRQRVDVYVEEMSADSGRPSGQHLLDINYQDSTGDTFLMAIIKLFGAMCGHLRVPQNGVDPIKLDALDANGAKEHLFTLLAECDLTLCNHSGLDPLNYLAHNIVVNAQCYTDWWIVTTLVKKAQQQGRLEVRDPSGETPFLHWAASGCTPNVLQLLIEHGADVDAVDREGNSALHLLVRSKNLRALQSLAKEPKGFLCRDWFAPNHSGQSALQLAESMHRADGGKTSQQILRLLQTAHREWQESIAPLLQRQLQQALNIDDLARLCLEYLDGSGNPFPKPKDKKKKKKKSKEEKQKQEGGSSSGVASLSPQPAEQDAAAAAPPAAAAAAPPEADGSVHPAAAPVFAAILAAQTGNPAADPAGPALLVAFPGPAGSAIAAAMQHEQGFEWPPEEGAQEEGSQHEEEEDLEEDMAADEAEEEGQEMEDAESDDDSSSSASSASSASSSSSVSETEVIDVDEEEVIDLLSDNEEQEADEDAAGFILLPPPFLAQAPAAQTAPGQ